MFGNLNVEFSICLTFFHMPEADFATVGGGGGKGTGIRDSLRSLSNNDGDGYENVS